MKKESSIGLFILKGDVIGRYISYFGFQEKQLGFRLIVLKSTLGCANFPTKFEKNARVLRRAFLL